VAELVFAEGPPVGRRGCAIEGALAEHGIACSYTGPFVDLPVADPFDGVGTFAGVMWFEAPASSSAPHFDGHHFPVVSFGRAAGCACAEAIGASPNFPCAAPATAPAAPAIPAVFRKLRRSGASGISSGERSAISVMAPPPALNSRDEREYPILD
jgi:hypothetical protein